MSETEHVPPGDSWMPLAAAGPYLSGRNAGVGSFYTAVFWNYDAIPASLTVYAICVDA